MGWIYDAWTKWLQNNPEPDSGGEGEEAPPDRPNKQLMAYIVVLGVVGLILLVFTGPRGSEPTQQATGPPQPAGSITVPEPAKDTFADELERELTLALSQMEGVGDVKVFITWEGGTERQLASRSTRDVQETTEQAQDGSSRKIISERVDTEPVIIRGQTGEEVAVIVEKRPQVRGVLVVADGAGDPTVRWNIRRAVQTALGIRPHQVSVVAKKQ